MLKNPFMAIPAAASAIMKLIPLAFIALVCSAVYFNALHGGFILDDYSQVLKNHLIKDLRNMPEVFLRSAWTFEGAPPLSNYYRPVVNLIYMFAYQVFGPDAWGFHLVNVLFHAGNSLLVFLITAMLLREPSPGQPPAEGTTERGAASPSASSLFLSPPFLAGLLFATHPIHTEAVTWIAGLPDMSLAFFFLLSFYLYIRSGGICSTSYLLSVATFMLALLCKEPGLVLPVILIAHDRLIGKKSVWSFDSVKRHMPYVLVACVYLAVRFSILSGFAPLEKASAMSSFQYVINAFYLFSLYLYKLILPTGLNFWPVYDPVTSVFSAEGMISLCAAVVFAGAFILALKRNNLAFLSLLLIAAPLAPALYLKGIIGKPFSERYLYLPSFGFVLLIAFLLHRLRAREPGPAKLLAAALALLIGAYSWGTVTRNSDWKDDYSLFADTVRKSPHSVVPRMEFGNALLLKGRLDEAIEQYREAIRMEPNLYVLRHHLGLAFARKGLWYEAVQQYRIALTLNPARPEIHADLGTAYAGAGFGDAAVAEFEISVGLRPSAFNHNLLGVAYARQGKIDKAIESFGTAVYLEPAQVSYRRNLEEAVRLKGPAAHKTDHKWEYQERPLTNVEMFSFAW